MSRLNRIYITNKALTESLYKRSKELCFTTEDVMRLHWERQGARALSWARDRIKRLRKLGVIDTLVPDPRVPYDGDHRRVRYRLKEEALKEWGLTE